MAGKTCLFEFCNKPASPKSKRGLCEYHLLEARRQTQRLKCQDAEGLLLYDEKTGMVWGNPEA